MRTHRYTLGLCLLAIAFGTMGVASGQDVDYDEELYNSYKAAINEPDLLTREDKILEFLKANAKSTLAPYAEGAYAQLLDEYRKQSRTDRVLEAGEKMLAIQPDNLAALYYTSEAAFAQENYAKAVLYGEKVYASNATTELAYLLALSFKQLGDKEKFLAYAGKVAEETPLKEYMPGHFQIVTGLRDSAVLDKKWEEASTYSKLVLEGFVAAKIPDGWDDYVRNQSAVSYVVLGQAANVKENWPGVISNYEKVIPLTDRSVVLGEAYFYIGLGNWRQNRLNPAMEAFARGSVQGGAHADACQRHLETLYKSFNNGSLAGLDEFKARATAGDPSPLE